MKRKESFFLWKPACPRIGFQTVEALSLADAPAAFHALTGDTQLLGYAIGTGDDYAQAYRDSPPLTPSQLRPQEDL